MRREHNARYSIRDTVEKCSHRGTLNQLSKELKIPKSTIVTALDNDRLIYRRYKVKCLG